ncbi:MAG: flagellar hook-length control protein FliK [Pirellulales bacterium]
MPDILLDNLFNRLPKPDASSPSAARGRVELGPSFTEHLGLSQQPPETTGPRDAPTMGSNFTRRSSADSQLQRTSASTSRDRANRSEDSRSADEPDSPSSAAPCKSAGCESDLEPPLELSNQARPDDFATEKDAGDAGKDDSINSDVAATAVAAAAQPVPIGLAADEAVAVDQVEPVTPVVQEDSQAESADQQPGETSPEPSDLPASTAAKTVPKPRESVDDRAAPVSDLAASVTELPADENPAPPDKADATSPSEIVETDIAGITRPSVPLESDQPAVTIAAATVAAAETDAEQDTNQTEQGQAPAEQPPQGETPNRPNAANATSISTAAAAASSAVAPAAGVTVTTAASAPAGPSTVTITGLPPADRRAAATAKGEFVPTESAPPVTADNGTTGKNTLLRTAGGDLHELSPRLGPNQTQAEAPARGLTQLERVQLVQRVARAVQTASDDGGLMRLRLSPPELGALRMEVSLRDGVLHARIEAETPQAQAALLENLPALRERLAEQDVRLGRFDVDLPNRQPGDRPAQQFQQDRQPADNWGQENKSLRPASLAAAAASAIPAAAGDGRIDITI